MRHLKLFRHVYVVIAVALIPIVIYWGWMMLSSLRQTAITSQSKTKPEKTFSQIAPKWPKKIPILMYHYIEYVQDKGDTIRQSLDISPYTFERQIQTLVNAGYTCITARELGEMFDGKREIPDKPVLLTFDDGYRDFYTDAYPIMKKYQVKGTVYVVSGFIGYRNYMTELQIQTIAHEELVEIGSHTVHHVSLTHAPVEEIQKELLDSKSMLEQLIGLPVVSFAYPNGSFDDSAVKEVSASGFTTAVITKPGIDIDPKDRFKLVRIRPGSNVGEDLLKRINQKSY